MRKLLAIVILAFTLGGVIGIATAQAHDWQGLVIRCEAKGVHDPWYANTGNGYFFGPQFTRSTWHANGGGPAREMDGYGPPMHHYSVQYIEHVADNTYRSQGPWAWPWCHGHGYI